MNEILQNKEHAQKLIEFFKFVEPEQDTVIIAYNACRRREDFKIAEERLNALLIANYKPSPGSDTDKLTYMINRAPSAAMSKDRDVTKIRLLAVDMDKSSDDIGYIHYDKLLSSPIPPHIIIQTRANGRYQAFWAVDGLPVWAFATVTKRLQRNLTEAFLGNVDSPFDPSIVNPSRLMRVPFFKAYGKDDGKLHLAELIRLDTTLPRYNVTDSTGGLVEALYGGYDNFFASLAGTRGIKEDLLLSFNQTLAKPLPDENVLRKSERLRKPGRPLLGSTNDGRDNIEEDHIGELSRRYMYVRLPHRFLDTETNDILSVENLKTRIGPRPYARFAKAGFQEVEDITFEPVSDVFLTRSGKLYFNTFRDRRVVPDISKLVNKKCDWFDRYLHNCFPPHHHKLIREWLASTVIHPETKLEWALVITGRQGSGKSSLFEIASRLYGDSAETGYLCEKVSAQVLETSFNGYLQGKLLIGIDELEFGSKTQAYNKMKSIISDTLVSVNQKGEKTRTVRTYHNTMITTNSAFPIRIPEKDDRKICLVKLRDDFEIIPHEEWEGYLKHDMDSLMAELEQISISLDPRQAPMTGEKRALLQDSKLEGQLQLDEYLEFLKENNQTVFIPAAVSGRGRTFNLQRSGMIEYLNREHGMSETMNISTSKLRCVAYPIHGTRLNLGNHELVAQFNAQKRLAMEFNNTNFGGGNVGTRIDFEETEEN